LGNPPVVNRARRYIYTATPNAAAGHCVCLHLTSILEWTKSTFPLEIPSYSA
jgi:hypothetical protein